MRSAEPRLQHDPCTVLRQPSNRQLAGLFVSQAGPTDFSSALRLDAFIGSLA